jgi:hypothetical protein
MTYYILQAHCKELYTRTRISLYMENDYILLYYQDAQDVFRKFKVTYLHSRLSSCHKSSRLSEAIPKRHPRRRPAAKRIEMRHSVKSLAQQMLVPPISQSRPNFIQQRELKVLNRHCRNHSHEVLWSKPFGILGPHCGGGSMAQMSSMSSSGP